MIESVTGVGVAPERSGITVNELLVLDTVNAAPHGMTLTMPPAPTVSNLTLALHWYMKAYKPFVPEYFQLTANGLPEVALEGVLTCTAAGAGDVLKREENHGEARLVRWMKPQMTIMMTIIKPTIAKTLESIPGFCSVIVATSLHISSDLSRAGD